MADFPPEDIRYEGQHIYRPKTGPDKTVSTYTVEYLLSELSKRIRVLEGG